MKKIEKIARKYGELAFRLAVNNLILVGFENYENADIEELCRTLSDKSSPKGLLTPELTKHIVRCAHEIASTSDAFTLMKYIKAYMPFDGVSVVAGTVARIALDEFEDEEMLLLFPSTMSREKWDEICDGFDAQAEAHYASYGSLDGFNWKAAVNAVLKECGCRVDGIEPHREYYFSGQF